MWGLEREWHGRLYEDPEDSRQGDLRWRLFRAAGELRDKAGCSLMLVPPPRTEPPPDFVQRNIFLTKYLRIRGTIPLDTFARCHFTQELYRMKWGWEARCSYEWTWTTRTPWWTWTTRTPSRVDLDDESPFPLYGNWEMPDGKRFFCEWYVDCPPCEDSIRGPCPPGGGDWDGQDADGLGHPDVDDFDFNY